MAAKQSLGVSNQFPALNSQQRLGGSPIKGRGKVALKPGRSLMDWIRLGNSGRDLTGVGHKVMEVTPEELAKHSTADDAWISLRGKVYNITPYLEYHPGELEGDISDDYEVKVHKSSGTTELVLTKQTTGQQWRTVGKFLDGHDTYTPTNDKGLSYRDCRVESVAAVNHDTKLVCVVLPEGTCMCVPVGYHVHVRHKVEGVEIVRSYTAVQPSLGSKVADHRLQQGKVFYLMIKIYKDGALTPWIDSLTPGDSIEVSQYEGNFRAERLAGEGDLVLYAAGTGFTPMVGLVNHCLSRSPPNTRKVKLMFFNKTEKDILWRQYLENLTNQHEWFIVQYVLSEADDSWTGPRGRIRTDLMETFSPRPQGESDTLICACGPTPFTNTVVQLAKDLGYSDNNIHAFLG